MILAFVISFAVCFSLSVFFYFIYRINTKVTNRILEETAIVKREEKPIQYSLDRRGRRQALPGENYIPVYKSENNAPFMTGFVVGTGLQNHSSHDHTFDGGHFGGAGAGGEWNPNSSSDCSPSCDSGSCDTGSCDSGSCGSCD